MLKSNSEVLAYINKLDGYRGYVQFSDRPLEARDVFEDKNPNVATDENGFVYEAHFSNGTNSIMIRQQNAGWIVSETDLSAVETKDTELYALEKTSHLKGVNSNWVKMAQIWKPEPDALCEGMEVMKLKKVVFAGFEKDKR